MIDSVSKTYLLPVGQADLSEEESLGLINLFTSGKSNYRYNSRAFNNFVVYESLQNESNIIFDERISISNYVMFRRENNIYLLITATATDSNKDKYLNEGDLQGLYLYEVSSRKLTKIESKEKTRFIITIIVITWPADCV